MRETRWLFIILLAATAILGGPFSCSARHIAPGDGPAPAAQLTPAASAQAELPAPSTLLEQLRSGTALETPAREVSYVEADLVLDGSDYNPALPHHFVTADGIDAVLTPFIPMGQLSIDDVAYATYHFTIAGYDRNPQLRVDWATAPAFSSNWFLALADWDRDTWQWLSGTDDGRINLPSLDPYFNFSDDLLAVVAVMGPPAELRQVRVGGLRPLASIFTLTSSGPTPLHVALSGAASAAMEGELIRFEWDLDGNGSFETDNATDSGAEYTYVDNGEYNVKLRVTNSLGLTDTATKDISAIGAWSRNWGLADTDRLADIIAGPDGSLFAVGQTSVPESGMLSALLLLKISATGNLEWARTWDTSGNDYGEALALNQSGDLLVAGEYFVTGQGTQLLVQRWTTDGDLVWSRQHGGTEQDIASAIRLDGNNIYLGGFTMSTAGSGNDFFACRLNPDGSKNWGRYRDHGETEFARDLCLVRNTSGVVQGVIVAGASLVGATLTPGAWKVQWAADGTFVSQQDLGAPAWEAEVRAVEFTAGTLPADQRLYSALTLTESDEDRVALVCHDGDGLTRFCTRCWYTPVAYARGLALDSDAVYLCGELGTMNTTGLLLKFNRGTGALASSLVWDNPATSTVLKALALTEFGLSLAGYSGNSAGTWMANPASSNGFMVNWVDSTGSGGEPDWTWGNDAAGTVTDRTLTFGMSQDQTNGASEALILHLLT